MRSRHRNAVRYADHFLRREAPEFGPILSVDVLMPRSLAARTRREIYPYPFPEQRQLPSRVIRQRLSAPREPVVRTRVRIRLPRHLPLVRGSYVSIRKGVLNVHSSRQLAAAVSRGELNRRRYQERKRHRRRAHHGQLDSPGAGRFGLVGLASRRGRSVGRIADAALVARALGRRR